MARGAAGPGTPIHHPSGSRGPPQGSRGWGEGPNRDTGGRRGRCAPGTSRAGSRFRCERSESRPGAVWDPDGAQTREGFRARPGGGGCHFCPHTLHLHADTRLHPSAGGWEGWTRRAPRRKRTTAWSADRLPLSQEGLRTSVHTLPAPRRPLQAKPRPRAAARTTSISPRNLSLSPSLLPAPQPWTVPPSPLPDHHLSHHLSWDTVECVLKINSASPILPLVVLSFGLLYRQLLLQ